MITYAFFSLIFQVTNVLGGQDSRATEAIGWAIALNLAAGPLLIGNYKTLDHKIPEMNKKRSNS